ncbi:MAG TPA: VOC family protein [Streptosporangiaceae bacterium]|nr:VOC family protein [Streptosporangiaceae bacterium]
MTAHLPGAASLDGELGGMAVELGATFDHVAIAGRRIRDMLPLWQDTLGGRFVVGADNPETGWRAVRLELAGVWCLELIEPLAGSAFLDRFLRGRPEGGLHHVTFLVDDVRAAFEWFTARGYEPFGADREWFQMFVHPRRAGGVLLQLMRRYEARGDGARGGARGDGAEGGGGARGDGAEGPAAGRPGMTLEDVLAGRGHRGTGVSSP